MDDQEGPGRTRNQVNIFDYLRSQRNTLKDAHPYIIESETGRQTNADTIWDKVDGIAGTLLHNGLTSGDIILTAMGNCVEFFPVLLSSWSVGCIVGTCPANSTLDYINKISDQVGAMVVITDKNSRRVSPKAVSYTHLTLPTKREVEVSVVAVS